MGNYYVSEWALRRKAEIIDIPGDFNIHPDYIKEIPKDEIIAAFKRVHQMFHDIYEDIAKSPGDFKMPLVEIRADNLTKYGYPPPEAQTSKRAPYMFLDALINVLISGELSDGALIIDAQKLIRANSEYRMNVYKTFTPKSYAIKNVDILYSQFERYGLFPDGFKHIKPAKPEKPANAAEQITLRYPGGPNVLTILKWMADKAHAHERRHDFMVYHHRLLQDDKDSIQFGFGADYIADKMHTSEERECARLIDEALVADGMAPDVENLGEASGEDSYAVYYYANIKDAGKRTRSNYKLSSRRTKLFFSIRVKNVQKCVEHIKACSDEIIGLFIPGDTGCSNRPSCPHGQSYIIDGKEYWQCGGLCKSMISFRPRAADIPDYIKLVKQGI